MLEAVANALRSPTARVIEDCCGHYQNADGIWGYRLTVWHAGHYHMISISHVEDVPKVKDIARALESPLAKVAEDGRYATTVGISATGRLYGVGITGTWCQYPICSSHIIDSGGPIASHKTDHQQALARLLLTIPLNRDIPCL